MKKLFKIILRKLKILNKVQFVYSNLNYWPHKNRTSWNLNIESLKLMYDTTDTYSRKWFYPRYGNGKVHEPIATKIFIDYIKDRSNVLDVGAHLGYFSCIAAKLAFNGKTYAFDVDPKSLQLVEKNKNLNNLKNIELHNLAISDKNETVKIQQLDVPDPGLVINSRSENNYIEVQSMTIDDFVANEKITPDFIKIDVEGAEAKVLMGMKDTLKLDHVIILVEVHVNHLRKYFDTDYKVIIDILLKNNFTIQNIDHRSEDSSFQRVDHHTELTGNTMLLCKK